jgi:hypothetical protein
MPCKACQRRRKALEEKRKAKLAKGKPVQAAALGAVLAVTAKVGKLYGDEDQGSPGVVKADHGEAPSAHPEMQEGQS